MKDGTIGKQIILIPESADSIREEAEVLLKRAKAIGIYPTPIDEIIRVAGVEEILDFEEMKFNFLKSATKFMADNLNSAFTKLRGIADLKKNSIYVTPLGNAYRENWTKLHELGHQSLKWQNIQLHFIDDVKSISPECEDLFDLEANVFAADVLFQGSAFKEIAESYRPDFNNFFRIADMHGASRQATARRFVENCDEPILLVSYYPSRYSYAPDGNPIFLMGRAHSYSDKFITRYQDLIVPQRIEPHHPWYEATKKREPLSGVMQLKTNLGNSEEFMWDAWWNQYRLLVMLRKKPKLHIVKSFFDSTSF